MKLFLAAVALMFSISALASLPPATFTDLSVRKITNAWDQSAASYEVDVDPYPQPSAEAAYVWAVYLAHAFEQAGFSLEATLYKYLAESHAGSMQMHIFVQTLGLQNIIVSIENPGYTDVYLEAGAISQRILDVLDAKDPEAPIRAADFILEGGPHEYPDENIGYASDLLNVGWMVVGDLEWEGWIIFSKGQFAITHEGVGIAEISKLSESDIAFFNSILTDRARRRVKMEGKALRNWDGRWFFDRRADVLIKTL